MKTLTLYLAAFIFSGISRAQVQQLINYQGRVAVGTVIFNGNGSFKFALVNAPETTTYWSNDGTSVAGSPPAAAVSIAVTKDLFLRRSQCRGSVQGFLQLHAGACALSLSKAVTRRGETSLKLRLN